MTISSVPADADADALGDAPAPAPAAVGAAETKTSNEKNAELIAVTMAMLVNRPRVFMNHPPLMAAKSAAQEHYHKALAARQVRQRSQQTEQTDRMFTKFARPPTGVFTFVSTFRYEPRNSAFLKMSTPTVASEHAIGLENDVAKTKKPPIVGIDDGRR